MPAKGQIIIVRAKSIRYLYALFLVILAEGIGLVITSRYLQSNEKQPGIVAFNMVRFVLKRLDLNHL
jgi:hypothetical protein